MSFTKSRLAASRPDGMPRPGDVLLFTNASGLSKVIPWLTGSRYYHCGLYEGKGCVLEARPQGVVRRKISDHPDVVVRVIPMPTEQGEAAVGYARSCLGKNYDVLDILFIMMKHQFPRITLKYSNHDSLVCSELVVLAWRKAGVDLFPEKKADEVIPGHFQALLPVDSYDITLYQCGSSNQDCTPGPRE